MSEQNQGLNMGYQGMQEHPKLFNLNEKHDSQTMDETNPSNTEESKIHHLGQSNGMLG